MKSLVHSSAVLFTLGACAASAVLLAPRDARACGGCFAPPVDSTVVTGHRMILSISQNETTLFDQIKYSGNPSSFAWVLPINGLAKIGLSADTVFEALDQRTRTQVYPPPANCPPPPDSCRGGFANSASADGGLAVPGVDVLKEETVGPYETVQLKATTPNALTTWLEGHGYGIPDDIKPLIAAYVADGFDFLALKLVPGAGVQSMRPVRVTTQGAQPSLPLRMVAAGSGNNVGITLWVFGDGRWEPQNFPSFAIVPTELTWTWATSSSNMSDLRAQKIAQLGASAWEIESSEGLYANELQYAQQGYYGQLDDGGYGYHPPYDPVLDDAGAIIKSGEQVAAEDLQALFQGHVQWRVTRMASTLPRASLATDLALTASGNQGQLAAVRQVTRETDEPNCPIYRGCEATGTPVPRSEAVKDAEQNKDLAGPGGASSTCAVIRVGQKNRAATGISLAAAAMLVEALRRRRSRSRNQSQKD